KLTAAESFTVTPAPPVGPRSPVGANVPATTSNTSDCALAYATGLPRRLNPPAVTDDTSLVPLALYASTFSVPPPPAKLNPPEGTGFPFTRSIVSTALAESPATTILVNDDF